MQTASQKAREALEAALKHVEHTCKVSGFFSSEDATGTPGPMPKEVTNYYMELRDQIAAALAALSEQIGDGDAEWLRSLARHIAFRDTDAEKKFNEVADRLTDCDRRVRELEGENELLKAIETAAHDMLYDLDNAIESDEWSTSELRAALQAAAPQESEEANS